MGLRSASPGTELERDTLRASLEERDSESEFRTPLHERACDAERDFTLSSSCSARTLSKILVRTSSLTFAVDRQEMHRESGRVICFMTDTSSLPARMIQLSPSGSHARYTASRSFCVLKFAKNMLEQRRTISKRPGKRRVTAPGGDGCRSGATTGSQSNGWFDDLKWRKNGLSNIDCIAASTRDPGRGSL